MNANDDAGAVATAKDDARILVTAVSSWDSVSEGIVSEVAARLLSRAFCATREDAAATQRDVIAMLFALANLADAAMEAADDVCKLKPGTTRERFFALQSRRSNP